MLWVFALAEWKSQPTAGQTIQTWRFERYGRTRRTKHQNRIVEIRWIEPRRHRSALLRPLADGIPVAAGESKHVAQWGRDFKGKPWLLNALRTSRHKQMPLWHFSNLIEALYSRTVRRLQREEDVKNGFGRIHSLRGSRSFLCNFIHSPKRTEWNVIHLCVWCALELEYLWPTWDQNRSDCGTAFRVGGCACDPNSTWSLKSLPSQPFLKVQGQLCVLSCHRPKMSALFKALRPHPTVESCPQHLACFESVVVVVSSSSGAMAMVMTMTSLCYKCCLQAPTMRRTLKLSPSHQKSSGNLSPRDMTWNWPRYEEDGKLAQRVNGQWFWPHPISREQKQVWISLDWANRFSVLEWLDIDWLPISQNLATKRQDTDNWNFGKPKAKDNFFPCTKGECDSTVHLNGSERWLCLKQKEKESGPHYKRMRELWPRVNLSIFSIKCQIKK